MLTKSYFKNKKQIMNNQRQALSPTSNAGSIMMYTFSLLVIANIAYFLYSVAI